MAADRFPSGRNRVKPERCPNTKYTCRLLSCSTVFPFVNALLVKPYQPYAADGCLVSDWLTVSAQ